MWGQGMLEFVKGAFDLRTLAICFITSVAIAVGIWVAARRKRNIEDDTESKEVAAPPGSSSTGEIPRTASGARLAPPSPVAAQAPIASVVPASGNRGGSRESDPGGSVGRVGSRDFTSGGAVSQVGSRDAGAGVAGSRVYGREAPDDPNNDALVDFYERLMADEETKDVEIVMQDGSIYAHSSVLCAGSEAIKGMLRHGIASGAHKRLSWNEHTVDIGQFFLRLLYTGTVNDEDWAGSETANIVDDVPLRLLIGSLAISHVYLVKHLLPPIAKTLKHRLCGETFNEIFVAAIRLDATALRLHCLNWADENTRCLIHESVREGTRVRAVRQFNAEYAEVPEGTLGTIQNVSDEDAEVVWDPFAESDSPFVNSFSAVQGAIELYIPGKTIREMYDAEELSPEVMFELAGLWGIQRASSIQRRRRRLV